jgi:hypothetical protein
MLDKKRQELVRKLLGSPALVTGLVGREREVAVDGYVAALRGLFLAGVVLAVGMVVVQAGTGWREPREKGEDADGSEGATEREDGEDGGDGGTGR